MAVMIIMEARMAMIMMPMLAPLSPFPLELIDAEAS